MSTSKQRTNNVNRHAVSDDFIKWAEGLTGLVAKVDSEYGGVAEMLEHPEWDASRKRYAVALLDGLRRDVAHLAKEVKAHVDGYQKVIR